MNISARKVCLCLLVLSHLFAGLLAQDQPSQLIRNDTDWLDTSGQRISAHEGGISRFGDTFYWYGTNYRGNPKGIYGREGNPLQNGFNVYRSTDLVNWTYEGVCLDFTRLKNAIGGTAHRPNVLYNSTTKKYVMWFFDFVDYPGVMMRVAVADQPAGPFEILGSRETGEPHGYAQDCGLFQDDDGKAYLVYDDGFRNLRVDLLSDDYLSSTKKTVIALKAWQEGSALIKYRGKYIVAGSGVVGWGGSDTHYAVADHPLGPYSDKKLMSQKKTWDAQISNFFYVKETNTVVALCDQWWKGPRGRADLEDSRYFFLPVEFAPETGEAKLVYKAEWNPFAAPGSPPPPAGFGASAVPGTEDAGRVAAQSLYDAKDWVMQWGDEFDQAGQPDPKRWNFEEGRVRNGEKQYFTVDRPENARVEKGHLVITARKETYEGADYTSASLTTLDRFAFTYGKVEIRAKVPRGRGTWAALWTLADYDPRFRGGYERNGGGSRWPAGGEIDILEYVGMNPDQLFFTVHTEAYNHTKGTQRGHNIRQTKPWDEFHRYGVVWTQDRIDWFFDGKRIFTFLNDGKGPASWPLDTPQYLIMNLAIGGGWGGQKGIDDTIFPSEFLIDYVRVWRRP